MEKSKFSQEKKTKLKKNSEIGNKVLITTKNNINLSGPTQIFEGRANVYEYRGMKLIN